MRTEDAFIVQECLNGESEAFGILVDKYKAGIYAYVYAKLGNLQDAEDATQEVFLAAYRSLNTLRRWESFSFWLYRLARNVCGNRIRTQSKRPDSEFIEDQDAIIVSAFSMNSYRENQVDESLREALGVLSEGYREVLMLHYFGGMKSADIARSLGMSPTAVRKRLSRARMQLREEMTAMMDTAFEGQRLPVTFTFRVVEAVKRIKINPTPRMAGVPLGLSLAMGIIITVMSLNPQVNMSSDMAIPAGSPLPAETKMLRVGEIPVDILKTDEIAAIASKQVNDNGGEPKNSLMLAPAAEGGTWTKKTDVPTARWGASASVVDGNIYTIGGGKGRATALWTVEEYDPQTDSWTEKRDMPTARLQLSTSTVNGRIYAIGGWTNSPVSNVEEYDPGTDTWIKKSSMPTARYALSTSVVDGRIYAIGGIIGEPPVDKVASTVEEYDPLTDTWTDKSNMLIAKYAHGASVVGDGIYIIGGGELEGQVEIPLRSVERYDPMTDTWINVADLPEARWVQTSAVALNGKIYAIGGSGVALKVLEMVDVYDPDIDQWDSVGDMPIPRASPAIAAVDGKIYVMGGAANWHPPAELSTVEEFDPGFVGVAAKGKLPTIWGEVKQR